MEFDGIEINDPDIARLYQKQIEQLEECHRAQAECERMRKNQDEIINKLACLEESMVSNINQLRDRLCHSEKTNQILLSSVLGQNVSEKQIIQQLIQEQNKAINITEANQVQLTENNKK